VDSADCLSISGRLVESFPHGFQVLCGEGFETDIDGETPASRESLQELLIKGHRNRGMAIPEKIELLQEREEFETESPVSGDVGIDDVKKSSLEEVGEVLAE
jgi:hypothetical protein